MPGPIALGMMDLSVVWLDNSNVPLVHRKTGDDGSDHSMGQLKLTLSGTEHEQMDQ